MFANDLGITDDLTMEKYLRLVSMPVLTSSAYDLSDAESPQNTGFSISNPAT